MSIKTPKEFKADHCLVMEARLPSPIYTSIALSQSVVEEREPLIMVISFA